MMRVIIPTSGGMNAGVCSICLVLIVAVLWRVLQMRTCISGLDARENKQVVL